MTNHQNQRLEITLSYKIFNAASDLPQNWDAMAAANIFLSRAYFEVLELSAPQNMTCHFIGIFKEEALVGIALSQFLNLNKLESFGERDRCFKATVRNWIFKSFSSHVLLIGNNMLTGQNAFAFAETIPLEDGLVALESATTELKNRLEKQGFKIHLTSCKDFTESEITDFPKAVFKNHYRFSTQPNMVFDIDPGWHSEADYISALSKKYRDQYKRARKKSEGLEKRKMHLEDILEHETQIYQLYFHVAKNAAFNTFFLCHNHFSIFKEKLKDKFLFYGYFDKGKLIGFNTLVKNGNVMDTYFLGYDEMLQREKMLYLNMLYDMIAHSINKGFRRIVFARTALEIKSSVGAKPVQMFGLIKHNNPLIQAKMDAIFNFLEPKNTWQQRHPFKE